MNLFTYKSALAEVYLYTLSLKLGKNGDLRMSRGSKFHSFAHMIVNNQSKWHVPEYGILSKSLSAERKFLQCVPETLSKSSVM